MHFLLLWHYLKQLISFASECNLYFFLQRFISFWNITIGYSINFVLIKKHSCSNVIIGYQMRIYRSMCLSCQPPRMQYFLSFSVLSFWKWNFNFFKKIFAYGTKEWFFPPLVWRNILCTFHIPSSRIHYPCVRQSIA